MAEPPTHSDETTYVDRSAPTTAVVPVPADAPSPVVAAAAPPPVPAAPTNAPRTARSGRRRSRRRLLWSLIVVAVLLLVAGGWTAAQRIDRPLSAPDLHTVIPASITVSGAVPSLPWPAKGQGAVSVPALDYRAQSGPESSVPIASLTKMTNALVILRDHPLPAGASGPMITITAADVAEYDSELHLDQSTVAIRAGEVLTERQMLEALLTQSANDIAYSLAVWDAGSVPAFVAKMNALAVSLGTTDTHYVDASGYDPGSVSTASDCLRIAAAGMDDPTFAEVVGMESVTLPLVGTRPNIVTEIGSNNVVGVKSGYTSQAGGCMVLAANRTIDGRTVLVLVAVLSQPTPPPTPPPTTTTTVAVPKATTTTAPGTSAPPTTTPPPTTTTTTTPLNDLNVVDPFRYTRPVVEALLSATEAAVVRADMTTVGQPVGVVTANWGGSTHRVALVAADQSWLIGWPGQQVGASTTLTTVPPGAVKGTGVGSAHYRLGTQIETVPLKVAATVPEPSWWWRLLHG